MQEALAPYYHENLREAGCDEAGRGCLAGPVVAAAVILPGSVDLPGLCDSKLLSQKQREKLEPLIKDVAVAYSYGIISAPVIDRVNILQASLMAMDRAVRHLNPQPEFLLVDGNRYLRDAAVPYECFIGGDNRYLSIAAASVLAKSLRDRIMWHLDLRYSAYRWRNNKGYGTKVHCSALKELGPSPYHRKSFKTVRETGQQTLFDAFETDE